MSSPLHTPPMEVDGSHSETGRVVEPSRSPTPPTEHTSSHSIHGHSPQTPSLSFPSVPPHESPPQPIALEVSPRVKRRREDIDFPSTSLEYEYNHLYAFQHSLDCGICRAFRRHLDHDMACFPHRFHAAWSSSDSYIGGLQETARATGRLAGYQDAQRKFDAVLQTTEDRHARQLASLNDQLAVLRAHLDNRLASAPLQARFTSPTRVPLQQSPPHQDARYSRSRGEIPRELIGPSIHGQDGRHTFRDNARSHRGALNVPVDGQPLNSESMRRVRTGRATLSRAPFPARRPSHLSVAEHHSAPHSSVSSRRGRDDYADAPDRAMAPPPTRPIPPNASAPPDAPLPYPTSFEETDELMERARQPGESDALATMARLSFQAQHCPARLRSHVEIYIIRHWRNPSSVPVRVSVDDIPGPARPRATARAPPRQSDPFPVWLDHYERYRDRLPPGIRRYQDGVPVKQDVLAWYAVMRLCPHAHRRGNSAIHTAHFMLMQLLRERGAFRRALASIPDLRVVPSIDVWDPLYFSTTPSELDLVNALVFRGFYAQFIEEYLEPYAARVQDLQNRRDAGHPLPPPLEDWDLPSRSALLPPIVSAVQSAPSGAPGPSTSGHASNIVPLVPPPPYSSGPSIAPPSASSSVAPTATLLPPHTTPSDILMAAAPASPLVPSGDPPPTSDVLAMAVNSSVSDDALMADFVTFLTGVPPVDVADSDPVLPFSGELGDDSVMFDGDVSSPPFAEG
ncbi:hypothetical protein BD410DRAFT_810252 [Rickenella mellea]|uniref:Uncharacterized protein n=1 Tax=Rickenella mellea TaxID=50990 RepID=A0A4Y7PEL0_9AGAM|nr:hypothetical protein BD410DRAFT_810255 [Rickenella mellea]TDL13791.1 hypothetical protein BD410DRAFT_810252 [Rickenella mellea]